MKNKLIFLMFFTVFFWASQSFAGTRSFMTTESTKNYFNINQKNNLTPRERIQLSEEKAQENPSLRGRWNHKSHEPASEGSVVSDDLAEKVLSQFREDESLSKLPVKLKVSSSGGVVILDGVVNNEDERLLIEEKVDAMEGVKKVKNQLKIKTSDQDLLD